MTISVAMTTCNGAPYLERQLRSIAHQLLQPDELVIGDDGSTDGTVDIVRSYERHLTLPVRSSAAAAPQGVLANVAAVLERSTGDHVALADQDDVWRADKLQRLMAAIEPVGAAMAFSDGVIIDEFDRPTGERLWQALDVSTRQVERIQSAPPGPLLRHSCASGCTMLVTRQVVEIALPLPEALADPRGPMLHDRWLALVASSIGPIVAVPQPLIAYRRHRHQVTGAARAPRLLDVVEQATGDLGAVRHVAGARIAQIGALIERLGERGVAPSDGVRKQLFDALAHQTMRANLPAGRRARVRPIGAEVRRGGYRRWSQGLPTAMLDVVRSNAS